MPHDVFLSYNRQHQPAVLALAKRLEAENLRPWMDVFQIRPGDHWQTVMAKALLECPTCAVIIGPGEAGVWQRQETELAIREHVENKKPRVIPVLLPGAEHGKRSELPAFLFSTSFVEFLENVDEDAPFQRLVRGIRGESCEAIAADPDDQGESPYRGLDVFDVEHAKHFFGREVLTKEWLIPHLRKPRSRFLAIVGPSGSGKSSVALAGLTAAIAKGDQIPGSEHWQRTILRPGSHPVEALALKLHPTGTTTEIQIANLLSEKRALHRTVEELLQKEPASMRLFLLVDQFEEVFTVCAQEELRHAFIDNLLTAAFEPHGRTIVVITVRADFYGHCATHSQLAAAVSEHHELVGPLNAEELRRAVERPAQRLGLQFDTGLVDLILADAGGEAGRLPKLEYALLELWRRAEGSRLTHTAYRAMGGVTGALRGCADEVLRRFQGPREQGFRRVLIRLIRVGADNQADTKQRVALSELLDEAQDRDEARAAIEALSSAEARLLVIDTVTEKSGDRETKTVFVEIAHEALIREWPTLREWVNGKRTFLLWMQRLKAAISGWEHAGRDRQSLLGGAALGEANEFLKTDRPDISAAQAEYIRFSNEARDERERELVKLRQDAEQQAKFSRSRELAAAAIQDLDTDPERSILLALQASQTYTGEAHNALQKALEKSRIVARSERHAGSVHTVAYSPVAELVASGGEDGLVRLWDLNAGDDAPPIDVKAQVTGLAFRHDGKHLAASCKDRSLRIWNVETRAVEQLWYAHSPLTCVAFNDDGSRVAAGAADGSVLVWTSSGAPIWEKRVHKKGGARGVRLVRWGSEGEAAVCSGGGDAKAVVWAYERPEPAELANFQHDDIVSGIAYDSVSRQAAMSSYDRKVVARDTALTKEDRVFEMKKGWVIAVSLSPGGALTAGGSVEGPVCVWKTESKDEVCMLMGHTKQVTSCAFSRDGNRLATASADGTVRVWRTDAAQESFTRETHRAGIISVASAARRPLVGTCGDSGGAKIWDPESGVLVATFHKDKDVSTVALSPDGSRVAAGCGDNIVRVWDMGTQALVHELPGHTHWIVAVTFHPNGEQLASCGADETVRIWNPGTGKPDRVLTGHNDWVNGIAYHPKSGLLATSSNDRSIKFWNPDDGEFLFEFADAHEDWIQSVAFHPQKPWLASVSHDQTVKLWDIDERASFRTMKGHTDWVRCVAFSPDGARLVTGGADNIAKVWTAAGDFLFDLTGHAYHVWGVGFTPDNRRIATGSTDNTARIWDAATGAEFLTFSEAKFKRWQTYSPDGKARLQSVHIEDLTALARRRLTRELSDAERKRYGMAAASHRGETAIA